MNRYQAASGRDQTGRFAKGNPGGPGRPRRRDLFSVATEHASGDSVDLERELWLVTRQLIAQAQGGDVSAARLLFSHLCGDTSAKSDVSLTVQTGVPMGDIERAERIKAILASGAARLRSDGKPPVAAEMGADPGRHDDVLDMLQ